MLVINLLADGKNLNISTLFHFRRIFDCLTLKPCIRISILVLSRILEGFVHCVNDDIDDICKPFDALLSYILHLTCGLRLGSIRICYSKMLSF